MFEMNENYFRKVATSIIENGGGNVFENANVAQSHLYPFSEQILECETTLNDVIENANRDACTNLWERHLASQVISENNYFL